MRIAQVVASYHPEIGGVEAVARRLAHGCAEAGDQVTVFTHQLDGWPAEEWMDGVRVLRLPLTVRPRNYQASLALFRYMKRSAADFDLVHAHSYHTLMGHAAIRAHLPFVFAPHYHGTGHTTFRAVLHRLYRSLGSRQFRAADVIICNSESERALVLRDFPWASAKLVTIPLGTDIIPPVVANDKLELIQPILLAVGRLESYKNVDLVLNSFRALPFPASLVVVGDGPDRGRLEQYAKESTQKRILFTGKVSDQVLQQFFAQASVVVSASDHESFGLAVSEGLASGARVLASAIPAHREIAERLGADAPITLVDVRDSGQFTEQMGRLLLEGRSKTAFQLQSWTDYVTGVRGLYSRIISAASSAVDRPSARETVPTESS